MKHYSPITITVPQPLPERPRAAKAAVALACGISIDDIDPDFPPTLFKQPSENPDDSHDESNTEWVYVAKVDTAVVITHDLNVFCEPTFKTSL